MITAHWLSFNMIGVVYILVMQLKQRGDQKIEVPVGMMRVTNLLTVRMFTHNPRLIVTTTIIITSNKEAGVVVITRVAGITINHQAHSSREGTGITRVGGEAAAITRGIATPPP